MYYVSKLYNVEPLIDAMASTVDGYMVGRWVSKVISEAEATNPAELMKPRLITVNYIINFDDGAGNPTASLTGAVELPLLGVAVSTQDISPEEVPF